MKLSHLASLVLPLLPLAVGAPAPAPEAADLAASEESFGLLSEQALNATLAKLEEEEASLKKRGLAASCTVSKLSIRKEFGSLSKKERKAYTDAVLCLMKKPAKTPASIAAGAKSRFDDFVVTHVQQTLNIHYTGTFLAWHRYYIHTYEQVLKDECGFKGSIPYWEWSKWASAPQNSPIFNGDAYSMGGNGKFIPGHKGPLLIPAFEGLGDTPIQLDAGLGGGCVEKGPFKDYVVGLGPVALPGGVPGPDGGLGYNPRCLKRDVGPGVAMKYTNWTSVLTLMSEKNIADFQWTLQGKPGTNTIGTHGGGHYTIGGDPGGDVFISPSDPVFYLHHGQVDRVWTIWQALDPKKRQNALSGTNTFLNIPPSADTTLEDALNLGYAGGAASIKMKDLMSTTAGPFCYIYL